MEASDRGERTKEERRGDSLVGGAAAEEPGLTAPPAARAAKLQYRHVREGGRGEEEEVENDFDPD